MPKGLLGISKLLINLHYIMIIKILRANKKPRNYNKSCSF